MEIYITNCDKKRSHEFLFYILDKFYGIIADESGLVRSESGKLSLMESRINFNITHSGNLIAIGISKNNLGIDIEELKEKDYSNLSKKYFGKIPKDNEEFFTLWTKAESYVKYMAKSVVAELKKIEIDGDNFIYDGKPCAITSTSVKFENYILSVTSKDLNLNIKRIEF